MTLKVKDGMGEAEVAVLLVAAIMQGEVLGTRAPHRDIARKLGAPEAWNGRNKVNDLARKFVREVLEAFPG